MTTYHNIRTHGTIRVNDTAAAPTTPGTAAGELFKTTNQSALMWKSGATDPISATPTDSISTGLISGGVVSATPGTTTFNITEGRGIIVNHDPIATAEVPSLIAYPQWAESTAVACAHIGSGPATYIYIDTSGAVLQTTTIPTAADRRNYIQVGVIIHTDNISIDSVLIHASYICEPANNTRDLYEAIGTQNMSGNILAAKGANLQLTKTGGDILMYGISYHDNDKNPHTRTLGAIDTSLGGAHTFEYRFRDGTSTTNDIQVVAPNTYDAGTSPGAAMPADGWQIQRFYILGNNTLIAQHGQKTYLTKSDAIADIEDPTFITEPLIADLGILICYLIIKQGATQLNDTDQATFVAVGRTGIISAPAITDTLQETYLVSSTPEITTTNGALSVQRGTAADTDNVLNVLNGGGATTFTVHGNGEINTAVGIRGTTTNNIDFSVDNTIDIITPNFLINGEPLTPPATINEYGSTGLISGGLLTINADPTKFNLAAGEGVIFTHDPITPAAPTVQYVSWANIVGAPVPDIGTQSVSYVSINSAGSVIFSASKPTTTERRQNILIGNLVHTNNTSIIAIDTLTDYVGATMSQLRDLYDAIGYINTSGNTVSKAVPTGLTIHKDAGTMLAYGSNYDTSFLQPNKITLADINTSTGDTFEYNNQNGTVSTGNSNIDPSQYDSGGTMTTMSANMFQTQRIFIFPAGNIVAVYGQHEYISMEAAADGIQTDEFNLHPNLAANSMLISYLVVREGTTDLSISTDALFIKVGKFSLTSGASGIFSLQSSYNASSPPSITTSTSNGAVIFKRGTAADGDTVISVQNGTGTDRFTVLGNGTISTQSRAIVAGTIQAAGLTYPSSDGTAGQVIVTNGSTSLSFSDVIAVKLATTGAPVSINTSAPAAANYILTSTSTTSATWQAAPAIPRATYTLASIELVASGTTYESVAYFAWDATAYSSYTNGSITMFVSKTDINLNVRLYDLTNATSLGSVLTPAAGLISFDLTSIPISNASVALQIQKTGAGTTEPSIQGVSLEFDI